MGCCGKKGANEDEESNKCGMVTFEDRKCRDVLCCVLFLAYWVGMVVVAIVGLQQGNPAKLIYGKDYNGAVCGQDSLADKSLLYYPRINEDMLYAMQNNIVLTDMQFYGFCVDQCPTAGQAKCGYADDACWTAPLDTENVFFRCLPVLEKNETILAEICIDPIGADPLCDTAKFFNNECSTVCKIRRTKKEVWDTAESTPNPVFEQLQGMAAILGRLTADVEHALPIVLLVGGAGALLLGILWLVFLQFFAGTMVWLTCFLVVITLTVLSLYCSVKAELIRAKDMPGFASLNVTLTEELYAAHANERAQFEVAAYLAWTLTGVMFLLILAMKKRIKIAIAIIREASKCIQKMPLLVLWPLLPAMLVLALVAYWMVFAAYIVSAESIDMSHVTTVLDTALGNTTDLSTNSTNNGTSTAIAALGAVPATSTQDLLFLYHLFGLLWTNQLIQAISICTIAGAVAQHYWTLPDQFGTRDTGRFPIVSALKRTLRFHLGSLCFGSLIIALVQLARIVLEYVDHNTRGLQDGNRMIKVIMKLVKCCLWCFEKCLKFLSKNAYIIIAMKGSSFCSSARQAFMLILANIARVATVNSVSFFLLLLAKITITAGAATFVFSVTSSGQEYAAGGAKELSSPLAPVLVTALIAWFVSSAFMNVYDMAIDTILVCFCEDAKLNDQGASEYMSAELNKIMGGDGGVKGAKKVQVSPKNNNNL